MPYITASFLMVLCVFPCDTSFLNLSISLVYLYRAGASGHDPDNPMCPAALHNWSRYRFFYKLYTGYGVGRREGSGGGQRHIMAAL